MNGPDSTALPDLCYEGDPELLPIAEAERRIAAHLRPVRGVERVALRAALGRVIAEEVRAPFDVPGHTNAAVDGYALAAASLPAAGERTLPVVGTAWAGRALDVAVPPDACARVMTGATMPAGTDTVVMQEQVEVDGDSVRVGAGHRLGQNVRQAGEDLKAGSTVVRRGVRLMPAELGLLASLGRAEVGVFRPVRVAFFSTGDELRSVGEPFAPGLVYDSNRYTLHGMLSRLGVDLVDMGVVRDDRDAVRTAFEEASAVADVVVTSGGVSAGAADYVKQTLDALGQVGFWKIAIRPGRPLAFGRVGDAFFFGLPGNPVAVMVTFYQFVQPALRRLAGERDPHPVPPLRATCVSKLRKKRGRTEYYRAVLERDDAGRVVVRHTGRTGSGLLHTMSDANCFIVLGDDADSVEPGTEVQVQPFFGLV